RGRGAAGVTPCSSEPPEAARQLVREVRTRRAFAFGRYGTLDRLEPATHDLSDWSNSRAFDDDARLRRSQFRRRRFDKSHSAGIGKRSGRFRAMEPFHEARMPFLTP